MTLIRVCDKRLRRIRQLGFSGFLPFLSSEGWACETQIEVDFDMSVPWSDFDGPDTFCRYSLCLERSNAGQPAVRVSHEALYTFPKGRPRHILERRGKETIRVAPEIGLRSGDERLKAVPNQASALAALAWMGVASLGEIVGQIAGVHSNILGSDPWLPNAEIVTQYYKDNPAYRDIVSNRLERFDIGIEYMEIGEGFDGRPILQFAHHGLDVKVPLISESSGTRHMVLRFPYLNFALEAGRLVVMDAHLFGQHCRYYPRFP